MGLLPSWEVAGLSNSNSGGATKLRLCKEERERMRPQTNHDHEGLTLNSSISLLRGRAFGQVPVVWALAGLGSPNTSQDINNMRLQDATRVHTASKATVFCTTGSSPVRVRTY
jgi:hypothetical protein